MTTPRVLIADAMSPAAAEIFQRLGVQVDVKTGLSKEELIAIIGDYHGLAVRSTSKVTADVIEAGKKLTVIGRAGIGVDTVDVPAATKRGIVVMNTPFGNAVTTAEHAIAMMFALARQIPEANASTHAGKWEKSRFMGTELTGKTIGIIGCGNIGGIVASRAVGLRMKVLAFDPFLTADRARELGAEKVELADVLTRSDFITLHTPLTEKTRNILSREALAKVKKGARIINCARGGLIDEEALADALDSGHIAGAALDVFETEPAKTHRLFGNEKVVCTPHLGASTREAQETVALQIAEQMSDFLLNGAVSNAVNMPSVTAEEAPRLRPYIQLAELLGAMVGQLTSHAPNALEVLFDGAVASLNTKALSAAAIAGVLRPMIADVNMVSAPAVLRERGIGMSEVRRERTGSFEGFIEVRLHTAGQTVTAAGTVLTDGKPRLIDVCGVRLDTGFARHMLYTANTDKPGHIGALGTVLGQAGINIANFNLGRAARGGDAVALVHVDEPVPAATVAAVQALPQVIKVHALSFEFDAD